MFAFSVLSYVLSSTFIPFFKFPDEPVLFSLLLNRVEPCIKQLMRSTPFAAIPKYFVKGIFCTQRFSFLQGYWL
jgi:hypothetical protein